ncbi:MAG TPA: methyltransferase [Acidimicrobiia bacterium]|jgi:SAM-dependent methyltransferase
MTDIAESASFRDPDASVFYAGDRVLRGLHERAAGDWQMLSGTKFFPAFTADGRIVPTKAVDPIADSAISGTYDVVLEHERIPFISYPYEWTFGMLRDAAVLHLEIMLAALDEGMSMKDGYSFNVQWRGATPTFIDIGSFERIPNGPWIGYRQFCQTFLYPLMLDAYLRVPFQKYLLGHLDGLEPTDMLRLLSGRRRLRKGVFSNVYLHSVAERRVTKGGQQIKEDLGKAGFGAELSKSTVRKLLKLVRGMRSKRSESGWKNYRTTCSYSDDDRDAKAAFLRQVLDGHPSTLAYDLGANDGIYARMVAERGGYVVAVDSDDVTVDAMYRSLRADGITNVLPLALNLVDPSPARGWRGEERRAFFDRARPDLVLALALVHHLALTANVPLDQIVSWLHSMGGTLVIEFVEPHDPMAKQLLDNKRSGLFPDYRIDAFEKLLEERYTVVNRTPLPGGTRTLYHAEPR